MNGLAVCAGIEGIGLGLKIACPGYRTVCCVEREAYAAAVLVKRMEEGWLDQAPVWDDLGTFDGEPWRGSVDIIHAGLPCQPYSVAGRRKGEMDERYIWPEFFRIVREVQPSLVFLENVPNLLAWFQPIGEELSRMGYEFEAGIFSASEVGASHRRERLFILAHRKSDNGWCGINRTETGTRQVGERWGGSSGDNKELENPPRERLEGGYYRSARVQEETDGLLPTRPGCRPLENPAGNRSGSRRPQREGQQGGSTSIKPSPFPPGPTGEWAGIPEDAQPAIRRVANGLPNRVGRLRALGNGVVPLTAAWAFINLMQQVKRR